MKELLSYMITHLVEKPEEVDIQESSVDQSVVFELRVGKEDLGKVIGKQGRTAKAIRTILNTASIKQGKRVTLEIVD